MADLDAQVAKQLENIIDSTGLTVSDFAGKIGQAGLAKHGEMVKFLKATEGLGHGNANLIAARVRELLAGGPASPDDLLAAQYAGPKAGLFPIYEQLAAIASGCGSDVEIRIQKTGVSFRRSKQFALIQAPSSKRIQLGLNFGDQAPQDDRVQVAGGMCTHKASITEPAQVDEGVAEWITMAYNQAM